MRPLADALDMLQADKNISIGYLLPTLTVLQQTLGKLSCDRSIRHCRPLIESLAASITKRFGEDFYDTELRLAAMFHPCFRLSWIPEEEKESSENFFRDSVSDKKAFLETNDGHLDVPIR